MVAMDTIALVNESTLLTNTDDVDRIATAITTQLRRDWAPVFERRVAHVRAYTTEARAAKADHLGVLLDDADQADALGYHDETPDGRQFFRVFVRPILAAGGGVLAGLYSVSATVSHEVLELLGDPPCNYWAEDGAGTEYAYELGDPVEGDSYDVDGVAVSNFVYPAWFDPQAPTTAQVDHLHRVARPFQMSAGGYVITRKDGKITETFGREVPQWRRHTKRHPASRTARRLTQA